jgi:FkbM family methyltransferase
MARRSRIPAVFGRTWRRFRGRPGPGVEIDAESVFLGTSYGGYEILPAFVSTESIVYSVGIGEDISFDLGLMERFGCAVHGFDPTPRSLAWLEKQTLPPNFHVHPYGLADFDGIARFAPPKNPAYVSHSTLPGHDGERIELPVKRLSTAMRELGHDRLDVLKLDIEGSEYGVLKDLLTTGPLPRQLLVEFHHGLGGATLDQTEAALSDLARAGYQVFDARETGREFSLVRK